MARSPDMVQMQCVMPPAMRNALDGSAVELREVGTETESLDRGEMLRRLFAWFLELPLESRRRLINGLPLEMEAEAKPAADRSKSFAQSYLDPNAPDGSTLGSHEFGRKRRMPGKGRVPDGQGDAVGK